MRTFFNKLHKLIYAKTGVFDNAIFSLPVVLVIMVVYWLVRRSLHKRKFGEKFNRIRQESRLNEIIRLLLLGWIAEIICVTLTPSALWDVFWQNIINGESLDFGIWQFSYKSPNFIPIVIDYVINGHLDWLLHSAKHFITHFAANIAMFIPLGLILPFVCKNISFIKATVIGLSCSFTIELIQCFLNRDSDVDDLICNIVGTALGYLLYLLTRKLFPNFTEKARMSANELWLRTC